MQASAHRPSGRGRFDCETTGSPEDNRGVESNRRHSHLMGLVSTGGVQLPTPCSAWRMMASAAYPSSSTCSPMDAIACHEAPAINFGTFRRHWRQRSDSKRDGTVLRHGPRQSLGTWKQLGGRLLADAPYTTDSARAGGLFP